jgi:hypothetical protein
MLARVPSRRAPSWCRRALPVAMGAAVVLAVFAQTAAAGIGAGSALSELTESQQTTTTVATAPTETTSTSNSTTLIIGGLAVAVALLALIAFVIVRDARRVAPVTDAELSAGGSSRDQAARLRQRRAKAKAARRQRKRNR